MTSAPSWQEASDPWSIAGSRYRGKLHFHIDTQIFPDDGADIAFGMVAITLTLLHAAAAIGARTAIFHYGVYNGHADDLSLGLLIRHAMRDDRAAAFLVTEHCIQYDEAFVAALRPNIRVPQPNIH